MVFFSNSVIFMPLFTWDLPGVIINFLSDPSGLPTGFSMLLLYMTSTEQNRSCHKLVMPRVIFPLWPFVIVLLLSK